MTISGEYNQQTDETYDEWKYRLLLGKANKQVDLNWEEIRQLLNLWTRRQCSSARLPTASLTTGITAKPDARMAFPAGSLSREKLLEELRDEREYLEREKMRLADQKREYRNLQRQAARSEHIEAEIRRAAELVAASRPLP